MRRKRHIRTYPDAGVLIAAARGIDSVGIKAMALLDDPVREFAASPYLALEVLPKAIYHRQLAEARFYEAFFQSVSLWAEATPSLVEEAQHHASQWGLGAMDALHVAAALSVGAHELITIEKPTKPFYRVTAIQVVSLLD